MIQFNLFNNNNHHHLINIINYSKYLYCIYENDASHASTATG